MQTERQNHQCNNADLTGKMHHGYNHYSWCIFNMSTTWQRGTNENTNGLLRQFSLNGTSFANIDAQSLQHIVDLINNRQRKHLNFLFSYEVLKKFWL